jgi:pimeloyl-ACP methyl ester carboxylesterase/CRP-like cAMP-binding protein
MSIYHIDGQEVHVLEEGSPNRQKVILIHGWSSSSFAMSPLAGLLSQRFHCLSVDLPGYGSSPPFEGRTTISRYAELVANLIEEISSGPVVLVGHSMGGMISTTVAIENPVLVERMVLISPTITGKLSKSINRMISPINMIERFTLGSLLVSTVEKLYVGLTDRLMRPVSFSDRSDITEQDYIKLRADARRPGQGKVRAECFFAMRDHDLSGKLAGIETPTLVIWGAEDNTVPLRDAGIMEDEWPETDLRILPKAGHWPHFESPDITRRLVAATLGLPLLSDRLHTPIGDHELDRIQEVAAFLAHSSIGTDMNKAQRTRLAAQLRSYQIPAGESITSQNEEGREMYVIQSGTVEVWSDPDGPGSDTAEKRKVAELNPGDMTGELAMLDQGLRTADLIAGPEGAEVLGLDRDMLLALAEDDPELGSKLLWNIAKAMSGRVRFILWQLERAQRRVRGVLS